ncbi:MAG: hypothetical protein KA419_17185 [Acidobacteria bacterium]|nr:hypothetical protein [Acidobacteriota bacterium]
MKQIKLGVIGFGNVIQGFLELLPEKLDYLKVRYHQDIRVHAICDRTEMLISPDGFEAGELLALKLAKNVSGDLMGGVRDFDPAGLVNAYLEAGVNVVLEALPTRRDVAEPALGWLLEFLSRRVPVVTSDKAPLVYGFNRLVATSRKHRTPFKFGGASAAALPAADTVGIALAGAEIYGFEGILNGTTNFLLSEMIANKSSIEEELQIAIEMKICESDPMFDVGGWDTAFKTLILAKAFMDPGAELKDMQVQGLEGLDYSHVEAGLRQGNTVKLLGKASFEGPHLRMRVKPSIITPTHPFFTVNGTCKAITFYTDSLGQLTLFGGASGSRETAGALLRDILNISRDTNFV